LNTVAAAAGDNEGAPAELGREFGNLAQAPGPENYMVSSGEFEAHGRSPLGIGGEEVFEFGAGAGLGHHVRDGIAPLLVVGGLFVEGGGVVGAIGFDQHEARGVIHLLDDIKASYAWFQDAVAGVFQGGFVKGFDAFGLNVNVNMND
jgi:hypothetical protein